jgi:solute carrier family 5 (sodium-dependent multivitamin transporter), member 6
MNQLDWIFLAVTLLFIIVYGVIKNKKDVDIDGYLLGNKSLPWYNIGLSVMATQASAITFLSAPGQAFNDGMRFVQFYFGLPLAMIVLSITFIPIFHKLKVFTAYEYLETRFDSRVRVFTSILFLIQRGLATGISIYAPSLILSTILELDIFYTNMFMGGIVLSYTVIGGTKAISYTHIQQMIIVTGAMFYAGYLVVDLLPSHIGFIDAIKIAGKSGKINVIDLKFDPKERYNLWSGLLGGFFLQLSYFGTDQSQVGRYLTGKSIKESRIGLLLNGLIKIPMQFGILLIGILVFVYYQFNSSPVFFNKSETNKLISSKYANEFYALEKEHNILSQEKIDLLSKISKTQLDEGSSESKSIYTQIEIIDSKSKEIKTKVSDLIKLNNPQGDNKDVNYIFLRFILDHLPHGFIGLLIAIIFSASMGSVASAYNSLAATSIIDIYKKSIKTAINSSQELNASKIATIFWGLFCIVVAQYSHKLGSSMIELVNILGSWFYGIILGIFLVAFYNKSIKSDAIFYGAIISQVLIIILWKIDTVAYLWLNPIGVILVFVISWIIQLTQKEKINE